MLLENIKKGMKMKYSRCPACGYPYIVEVMDSQSGEFLYYMCKQCGTKYKIKGDSNEK